MRKKPAALALVITLLVTAVIFAQAPAGAVGPAMVVPVKGMATLVDVGAASCIPCKMMAPILEKLEKRYEGKAAVIFIDVRYYPEQARRLGIRGIPTQIFYDAGGNEVHRHIGYMSEAAIVAQFKSMGIE
ncbi:MAG: Thioredoxin [Syntrophaceae bacterium PtaU1.Bin231]|nr:MAG: Thioredoxin [Syntrophaceae bacterium PtaU1.Bin231]